MAENGSAYNLAEFNFLFLSFQQDSTAEVSQRRETVAGQKQATVQYYNTNGLGTCSDR